MAAPRAPRTVRAARAVESRAMGRAVPTLALAALVLLAPRAEADVVTLTDGKTLEGKVTSQTDAEVVIETTFDGVKTVPKAQVKSVDKTVPPLRVQLKSRHDDAGNDPAKLWEVHDFAKRSGVACRSTARRFGKRIGCDVENAHDERPLAKGQNASRWQGNGETAAGRKTSNS